MLRLATAIAAAKEPAPPSQCWSSLSHTLEGRSFSCREVRSLGEASTSKGGNILSPS